MKPERIFEVLDLAYEARKLDLIFNPMFIGEAGLGKSEIIQQWVAYRRKTNPNFGFLDFRLAYYEGPDFVGYPKDIEIDGRWRTIPALPGFWPTEGEGIILLEEPNRGNTMIMNCLMQLTDKNRSVGTDYTLPKGYMIVSALNPEGAKYDVNNMDTALLNRFETFDIDYHFTGFMNYVESADWHPNVVNYLRSGIWVYKTPDAISTDGKYISPRTWSKMNAAEQAGASSSEQKRAFHRVICQSILGKHIGNEYWKTCWDDAPILASDLLADMKKAINKLKKQASSGNTYAGDKVAITVESIIENYGGYFDGRTKDGAPWPHEDGTVDETMMVAVAKIIPSDQAVNLIKGCGLKVHRGRIQSYFKDFAKRNKDCVQIMRDHIKLDRAVRDTQS